MFIIIICRVIGRFIDRSFYIFIKKLKNVLKDEVGVCCVCVCFYNLIRFLDHIVAFEVYQQLYVDLAEPIFLT